MPKVDVKFPLFRKSANCRNFYRISAPNVCTEIMSMGKHWIKHEMIAEILPSRLFITDLMECIDGAYLESSEDEFLFFASKVNDQSEKQ